MEQLQAAALIIVKTLHNVFNVKNADTPTHARQQWRRFFLNTFICPLWLPSLIFKMCVKI